jgi:glycosyltransferase involved in cell wall biosynthesis
MSETFTPCPLNPEATKPVVTDWPPPTPTASIIIPAHNEENVIGRCLDSILADAQPHEFEILVVCNGCTDGTAAAARKYGTAVRVLETSVGSKSYALNMGDCTARSCPRFYLDADIVITTATIRETIALLKQSQYLASAPKIEFDLTGASMAVRSFYRIWQLHPYFRRSMIGSGLYALSEAGRKRFKSFPKLTADDAFIHRLFKDSERVTLPGRTFTVRAPLNLGALIRTKTRSRRGNIELEQATQMKRAGRSSDILTLLVDILHKPSVWKDVPVYAIVVFATMVRARMTLHKAAGTWERDESTRQSNILH